MNSEASEYELIEAHPRTCVWELSLLCDLRCKHCGSYAGAKREDELTGDELRRVADQLIDIGCELVTLGGGEPTLHPLWAELGRRLTDGGVAVNMITNGWGFSPEKLEQARQAGLVQIAFSLDGLRPAHDRVRRTGSFDRVLRAIDQCVAAGMVTSAVTHINQLNCRTLSELRSLLREHGVDSWQLQLGNPSGAMGDHSDLVLDPKELLWLLPHIVELRADASARPQVDVGDNIGYYGVCEAGLRRTAKSGQLGCWGGCMAGLQVVGIESNGNVKGCLSLPSDRNRQSAFIEGNLREATLEEIWTRPDGFAYNRDFTEACLASYCRSCDFRALCRGGCAWTAFSHTGQRGDNPYCFHRVAQEQGRTDLLVDAQTVLEQVRRELRAQSNAQGTPSE